MKNLKDILTESLFDKDLVTRDDVGATPEFVYAHIKNLIKKKHIPCQIRQLPNSDGIDIIYEFDSPDQYFSFQIRIESLEYKEDERRIEISDIKSYGRGQFCVYQLCVDNDTYYVSSSNLFLRRFSLKTQIDELITFTNQLIYGLWRISYDVAKGRIIDRFIKDHPHPKNNIYNLQLLTWWNKILNTYFSRDIINCIEYQY